MVTPYLHSAPDICNARMIHFIGTHRRLKNTARPTKPDTIEIRPKTKHRKTTQRKPNKTRSQEDQKASRETTTHGFQIPVTHTGPTGRGTRRRRSGKKTAPPLTQTPTTTDDNDTARCHKGQSSQKKSTAPQGAPCLPTTIRRSPPATDYVSYLQYYSAEA